MKLKIKVTKDVLLKSYKCLSRAGENCAIAVAVRDIFPDAWVYAVSINPFFSRRESNRFLFPLPKEATLFIHLFDMATYDERLAMPELEFEVDIPDEVINEINIDEIKPLLENHPTLELITN